MNKTMTTMIASIATAILLTVSPAHATVYNFTFESFDSKLMATGAMTVNAVGEVTGISGQISGLVDQTISLITPNPNFPGPAYSPDGLFIYNNLYYSSGMAFDVDGVLFATPRIRAATGTCGGIRQATTRSGNRPVPTVTRSRKAEL